MLRFWMQSMMPASDTSLDFSQSINRLISLAVMPSIPFPPALDLPVGFPPDTYSIQQTLYVVKPFVDIFLNFFRIRLTLCAKCYILIEQGGMAMTTEQMIKMALSYAGVSQAELARRISTTPSNLNQKIKRNTLTREELSEIATALGAEFIFHFRFPDGQEI